MIDTKTAIELIEKISSQKQNLMNRVIQRRSYIKYLGEKRSKRHLQEIDALLQDRDYLVDLQKIIISNAF
jgi:hypothetical protein